MRKRETVGFRPSEEGVPNNRIPLSHSAFTTDFLRFETTFELLNVGGLHSEDDGVSVSTRAY